MADYIEFTVNVNEDAAIDSNSVLNEKVRNASAKPDETSKLEKQAKRIMEEANEDNASSGTNSKALKAFVKNQVVKDVVDRGLQIAETTYSQQLIYGGNTAQLNKMNNTMNHIKSGVSIITGITGYTAAGAVAGPIGAAIGFTVGTVMAALDSVVSYNTNKSKLDWDLQKEQLKALQEANRLGISSSARGRTSFKDYRL